MSAPAASAYLTCFGCPTIFITNIPALCSLSTMGLGGTPMAQTNNFAPDSIMMSTSLSNLPFV